ncbi:MAG: PQQ-binding-like beta-propeller repeat protein [Planctomycetota bacterium]|jgi:outer membrane protein assembly factor BamB
MNMKFKGMVKTLRLRITVIQCIFAVLIGGYFSMSAVYAADESPCWPQFHGPNRDNISTETGLLKQWPEGGPELLWTVEGLGHGFSSMSIASGMIYTAGNIEKDTVITAINTDGKVLWQKKNGEAWKKDYPGTRGTPTIDGEKLYHQSPLGNLICMDAKTGEAVWQVNVLDKFNSKTPRWALAESLLIDGDNVISCPGGPKTCMAALDKKTGETVWTAPGLDELAGYSTAVITECDGLRIIITLTSKAIIGVNADTGELLWHVKHESYADENIIAPIVHDGHVFISTLETGSVKWKLNVKDGEASLEKLWDTRELDNHHGGVILIKGNLYGSSTFRNSDELVCLDWETGEKKFMDKATGKVSLTYADGMLYTLSIDRLMSLVLPTSSGHKVVSSFKIPKGGKGKSWAHPVVCDGYLYIRHGQFLYAYNVRK